MNNRPARLSLSDAITALHTDGFVHLPNVIDRVELDALRDATDAILTRAHALKADGKEFSNELPRRSMRPSKRHHDHLRTDVKYCRVENDEYIDGNTLCRIEYLLEKDPAFIRLLGHPTILNLAAQVFQETFLLTWEDMIIKVPYSGIPVPAHQDLKYQSTRHFVFSMGIYLDDAFGSPFECLPGSHRLGPMTKDDIKTLCRAHAGSFRSVPARSGDLIVHNVQVVHRSPHNATSMARRTLYFEFRSVDAAVTDSPWSVEWVQARLAYLPRAAALRTQSRSLRRADRVAGLSYDPTIQRFWALPFDKSPMNAAFSRDSLEQPNWRVDHDQVQCIRDCDLPFL